MAKTSSHLELGVLAGEAAEACSLLAGADPAEREAAEALAVDRVRQLLQAIGFGVHRIASGSGRVRGSEPAFRVESVADYVVRDARRAAGLARSRAAKSQTGLCTPEPLEEDAMGVLLDLLDLEVSASDLEGVVDVIGFERHARALTASERSGGARRR